MLVQVLVGLESLFDPKSRSPDDGLLYSHGVDQGACPNCRAPLSFSSVYQWALVRDQGTVSVCLLFFKGVVKDKTVVASLWWV